MTFAGETSPAWLNVIISQLYQFGFDSLFIEFIEDSTDNYSRVAVFSGTPVDTYNFHNSDENVTIVRGGKSIRLCRYILWSGLMSNQSYVLWCQRA